MGMKIISVDLQNEFATEGGALYGPRRCVPFLKDTFFPFVREHGYTITDIISDYRVVEPATDTPSCVPGQWSYQSIIPPDVRHPSVWVKAEPSPAWTRDGVGQAEQLPGMPYPDSDTFSAWLASTIGPPQATGEIILIGLMLEICVLSTLQELKYRGYRTKILFEGVDTFSGSIEQKRLFFEAIFPFWGEAISWQELKTTSNE